MFVCLLVSVFLCLYVYLLDKNRPTLDSWQNGLTLIAIVGCVLGILDAVVLVAVVVFIIRKK